MSADRLYYTDAYLVEFDAVVRETCDLLEAALGAPADDVGGGNHRVVDELDHSLLESIRRTADIVVARREDVADVLSSVSLLGRLDHVRVQAATFPAWEG